MAPSRYIAGLAGPTLVVMTVAEALNFHIWTANIAPLIFLNGTLLFFAGLAIVRSHNIWVRGWPVAVTLTGWLGIVLGLVRMLMPDFRAEAHGAATYAEIGAVLALGVFLTVKGYGPAGPDDG